MNFFKKIFFMTTITLSLFAAGMMLQKALQMYQHNTLKEHPEAIQALTESANANNPDAVFLLATSYKEGKIGHIDLSKAFYWYSKAAQLGDGDAMLMLGWLYYEGNLSGRNDIAKARLWFSKAAELGIDEAIEMLNILDS